MTTETQREWKQVPYTDLDVTEGPVRLITSISELRIGPAYHRLARKAYHTDEHGTQKEYLFTQILLYQWEGTGAIDLETGKVKIFPNIEKIFVEKN